MEIEYEVTASSWTGKGEAFASRPGQKPICIWRGIPGEEADLRIHRRGQNTTQTSYHGSDMPSPYRVEPSCDKMDMCGGCPWMHLSEEGQREHHEMVVKDAFDELGLRVMVAQHFSSPDGLKDFRYSIKVGSDVSDRGSIRVGAWGRRYRRIVPIPQCEVAAPVLRKAMACLAHHVIDLEVQPYSTKTEKGYFRAAVMRASRTTGQVLITLVATKDNRAIRSLAERLTDNLAELAGVWLHINSKPTNAIYDRDAFGTVRVKRMAGVETIEETLNGVTYSIGPGDFFQTNPAMAEKLYERVVHRLNATKKDTVIDLYCGVGGYALQVDAGFVLGVESIDGAVRRAKVSARTNRKTAEFFAGDVADQIEEITKRVSGTAPKIVVNPARRGLEEGVIDSIVKLEPSQIVYVSCSPYALARDAKELLAAGYELEPIELFEMFPNTHHVEVLASFVPTNPVKAQRRSPRRRVVR